MRSRFATGTLLDHYRIEGVLGRGGMGTVYRATDTKLNRPVAIKFLTQPSPMPHARRRFKQEAETTSALIIRTSSPSTTSASTTADSTS